MATDIRIPKAPPDDAVVLTLEEVAYVLRCSERSVRRMVGLGQLATVRLSPTGARRGVRRESLARYLRDNEASVACPEVARATPEPVMPSLADLGWDDSDPFASRSRRPAKGKSRAS